MIRVENIGVLRDDWVLRSISLDIEEGCMLGIIGRSGAGKTTFLKAISGLIDTVEGHVTLDGKKLIGPSEKLVPGYEDIQLVNQDFALEPFHTVRENIREKVLHLHRKDQEELADELLALLELEMLADRQARWLSGGEQQRLSIARALACEPRFLLLDEPFVHLDQSLRLKVMHYLQDLNAVRRTGIVLVSHDGAEMMGFVKNVAHLQEGQLRRISSVEDMYYAPQDADQAGLLGLINTVHVHGEERLFRPSEYVVGGSISVAFLRSFDTGVVVFNYFVTANGEEVVLTAQQAMTDVHSIDIRKRK